MPVTLTAGPPSEPLPCVDKVARTASNIGCRARYTCAGSLATLSAFARLLAVVFSRTDCAAMPDPAMSNALKDDMMLPAYLTTHDRGQEAAEFRVEKCERGLVAHRVLGERRLLDLRVDGIAVEGRRKRRAVLEVRI